MTTTTLPDLLKTPEGVVTQVQRFSDALEKLDTLPPLVRADMIQILSHAQVWVAVRINGVWHFAPAKFSGYDVTPDQYHEHRIPMSGTRAVQVIRRWAYEPSPGEALYKNVEALCSAHGVRPYKGFTVLALDNSKLGNAGTEVRPGGQPPEGNDLKDRLLADLICALLPTLGARERGRVARAAAAP